MYPLEKGGPLKDNAVPVPFTLVTFFDFAF